jgi:hypothetical protein
MAVNHNQLNINDRIYYFGASFWQPARVVWRDEYGILLAAEEKFLVQVEHHNGVYHRIASESEMAERRRVIEKLEAGR